MASTATRPFTSYCTTDMERSRFGFEGPQPATAVAIVAALTLGDQDEFGDVLAVFHHPVRRRRLGQREGRRGSTRE